MLCPRRQARQQQKINDVSCQNRDQRLDEVSKRAFHTQTGLRLMNT